MQTLLTPSPTIKTICLCLMDYDGDGDTTEGIYYEIQGLQQILYGAMQAYGPSPFKVVNIHANRMK